MSRKTILLISLASMLVAAGSASAEFVAHWRLDETSGTTAYDSSGNGNDGTLSGNPQWEVGMIGGALHFDGSSDYVQIPFSESLRVHNQGGLTNAAWFKFDAVGAGRQLIFQQATLNGTGRSWLQINPNDVFTTWLGGAQIFSGVNMQAGEWYHGAVVVTEGGGVDSIQLYVNGEPAGDPVQGGMGNCEGDFFIGCHRNIQWFMDGLIDDLRIYSEGLTQEEIQIVMEGIEGGYPLAMGPAPEDGALYEQTWATLRWTPGDWAVSHNLYFGTDFDDVNDGAEGTFIGNLASAQQVVGFPGFPAPQGLEPGTIYYWRVDEVNDANDQSPWKGNVWSFQIPPKNAYDPIPADGRTFADPNIDLSWAPGLNAVMDAVYIGTDADEVANAAGAPPVTDATFDPGTLASDTTHYWRVDTFDGLEWTKGEVWSFTTLPDMAITDPSLAIWWTLDEGPGSLTAVDWSGHGHHGTLLNGPQWADGVSGAALQFDGLDDYLIHRLTQAQNFDNFTVALWAKAATLRQGQFMSPFSSHSPNSLGFQIDIDGTSPGNYRTNTNQAPGPALGPVALEWVHLALVAEGTTLQYYYNGTWSNSYTYSTDELLFNEFIIGTSRNTANYFDGAVDDLRVYTKALTQEEVQLVMRGNPLLAWEPSPKSGSTPDIENTTPLSWSPGDMASGHDVYFAADKAAVADADASDTTGVYRGRQNGASYTPPEGVLWGGGPYYWRIDENNTDGTVTKGRIWSFTVADYVLLDDMESYNDVDEGDPGSNRVYLTWLDGFGIPTNGSTVGDPDPNFAAGEHIVETIIVHDGAQSMPFFYNNAVGNSEATMTISTLRDWTKHGIKELSLWFRGYPASEGSFAEGPVGTYTMTGAGAGVGSTADEFHFAYKTLAGLGSISIVARVDSITGKDPGAMAGVMIRESLDADSKHAFACITSGNSVAFQGRTAVGGDTFSTNQTGLAAPYWVKLERDAGGNFTAYHSANGTTWQPVENTIPTNVPMTSAVHVGLAVTSHNTAETCEAKFSNVTITGSAGQQWAHQDIGIRANDAEPLYVALSNSTGTSGAVLHDDPEAATTDTWTEWVIDLQAFADQGVNLTDVDSIAIGLGTKGNATGGDGSGTLFIDDIRLLRPAEEQQP